MWKSMILAAALFGLAAAPAWANSCPRHMADIDAALAKSPAVSAETLEEVKKLRAEGERLHVAGKHAESVEALTRAKALLGG